MVPQPGGQFALPTTALAQGVLADSQEDVALQIDLEHRGRAGDSDVALDTIELRFENGAGDGLDSTQANDLIEKLELFLDDGTGSFEFPGDTLVEFEGFMELENGVLSIPLAAGDPAVQVAFGETTRYFVVVTMQEDASAQTPDSFELIHLTESSSSGHDASTPAEPFTPLVPLRLEYLPNTDDWPHQHRALVGELQGAVRARSRELPGGHRGCLRGGHHAHGRRCHGEPDR